MSFWDRDRGAVPDANAIARRGRERKSLKACLSAAKRGSIPDVVTIVSVIMSDNPPVKVQVDCVTALLDAFEVLCDPEIMPVPKETTYALRASFGGLAKLGENFFALRPRLLQRCRATATTIFAHAHLALFTISDHFEKEGAEETVQYIEDCMQFMTFAAKDEHIRLWGDNETFKHASRIWLEEWSAEGNIAASRMMSVCMCSIASAPTRNVGAIHAHKRKCFLEIASSIHGFSPNDVMRLLLWRLRSEKAGSYSHINMVMFFIGPWTVHGAKEVEALYTAFSRNDGVRTILDCIDKTLKKWNFNPDAPNTSLVTEKDIVFVSHCFDILKVVFNFSPGFSVKLLEKALRRNLIRCIACCSMRCIFSMLKVNSQEAIQSILKDALMRFLYSRRIAMAIHRSIVNYQLSMGRNDSDKYSLSDVFPSLTMSGAQDEWEALFDRLYHQLNTFRIISLEMKAEIHSCGNPSCETQGTKDKMRRCAGCYLTFYCSRECQTIAWREHQHKLECSKYQNELSDTGVCISDAHYLVSLAYEDTRRMLPSLFGGSPTPKNDGGPLRAHVSYVRGPPEVFLGEEENMPGFTPGYPMAEVEGGVKVGINIMISWGAEENVKMIWVDASFDRADFEVGACSCCRFHEERGGKEKGCSDLELGNCPVHSKMTSRPSTS